MKEDVKLNPCPCCGGSAKIQKDKGKIDVFRVKCSQCGIKTGWWNGYVGAVDQWNKRVSENPKPEQKIYLLIEDDYSCGGMKPEKSIVAASFSRSVIQTEMQNLAKKWELRGIAVARCYNEIFCDGSRNRAYIETVPFCG